MESKAFYDMHNNMQEGWGNQLRCIDRLRTRVNRDQTITLNDALWIHWAEGMSAFKFEALKEIAKKLKITSKKFRLPVWKVIIFGIRKMNEI